MLADAAAILFVSGSCSTRDGGVSAVPDRRDPRSNARKTTEDLAVKSTITTIQSQYYTSAAMILILMMMMMIRVAESFLWTDTSSTSLGYATEV